MDNFDESFAIETEDNEWLGECGMGISESLDDGTPRRVTAFEVWLFDKPNTLTVTKVLMSDYANNNEALRNKLASPVGNLCWLHRAGLLPWKPLI